MTAKRIKESGKERRKEKRLRVNIPITIDYSDASTIHAKTENISRLGTYIEIEQEIPLGTQVDVVLDLPDYSVDSNLTGKIRCQGDVFRCDVVGEVQLKRIYGIGIFFVSFAQDLDRNKLSQYIDFLIVKEQEEIKQALQQWRKKRRKHRH